MQMFRIVPVVSALNSSILRTSVRLFCSKCPEVMSEEQKNNSNEESKVSGEYRPDYPWKKVKKCAAMLSFSGKNYHGMQRNQAGEIKTIESELLAALAKSGQIIIIS